MVERLCQKYHKLPSEVLEEEMEWIRLLLEINALDNRKQDLEEKRANLRNQKNG